MNLRNRFKDQRGFNLIELMIVIAIIGLLIGVGSLAWGAMIRSGNETAAIQVLERMRTFQAQYASSNKGKFGTFDQLLEPRGPLDKQFAGEAPVVNGYVFTIEVTEPSSSAPGRYQIWAEPQSAVGITATGTRYFYTNSGLNGIKTSTEGRATETSDAL